MTAWSRSSAHSNPLPAPAGAPTAKGWRDKQKRSFKVNTDGKIELTDECRSYFSDFPPSKQIPFETRAADWKNGEPAPEPTNNPQPGLSSVWSDLKNIQRRQWVLVRAARRPQERA